MTSSAIRFKYKELNDQGGEVGFLSKKGAFDGETLKLDVHVIPVEAIVSAHCRFNRIMLQLLQEDGEVQPAIIAITGGDRRQLLAGINAASSARWAEMIRADLEQKGKGDRFYAETCPYCRATIDLTDVPESPQTYCRFCESIITSQGQAPEDEADYRTELPS